MWLSALRLSSCVLAFTRLASSAYGYQLIDTHHHFVPDFYREGELTAFTPYMTEGFLAVIAAGGDPSGWPIPVWHLNDSEAFMQRINTTMTMLSLTSPGAAIAKDNGMARTLARRANEYCAQISSQMPDKFGCWAAMPNLLDIEGSLVEISYALDNLGANGITLFTRYGDGNYYLGNPAYEPIWAELHRRNATVFIHPSAPVDTKLVNPSLLLPTIDYPHETTLTAVDMIISRTRVKYPNCKVILSHAGGNLPWLFTRFALWRKAAPVTALRDGITYDEALADLRSFHYDLALSSSPEKLDLLLKLVPAERILYGSDFPYAPTTGILAFRQALEDYPKAEGLKQKIYYENALSLIG